ncbi:MAG: acyltransferase domain-containing protein [Deltaproteobacteria bacterium]|nr:acyltransferase domain-containing protein [Deltaproteobacteria bacterium]
MSLSFEPIAIIGRACVLPGAMSPRELWDLVLAGKDVLSSAPPGRWGIAAEHVLAASPSAASCADRTWTDRGGYVQGFEEQFDPGGFAISAEEVARLDPLFQWVLHTAREALRDAGHAASRARVGAIFGNLSFPSRSMSRYAESVWMAGEDGEEPDPASGPRPDPRNRFTSGLPALILERGLSLEAGAFALDAACASSLYAIKSACDWLHDERADIVLAGAVNCADDLFIHVGFSALSALSRSGRSRPFNREADGLVPAEGAAFVALRRLEDARRDGDPILGVIRGVGLSNDGRGQGALVPSREGQVRAMRAAYEMSGLSPRDISLLECHATGTAIGDATEIESLTDVFGTLPEPLGIGSLKSNMGHLITAAGVAGLMKVLEGMHAGVRPPTLHAEAAISALDDSSFRVLERAEPWTVPDHVPDGVRRAGISAFGFGGNNAHLIVEEFEPERPGAVLTGAGPDRGGDAAPATNTARIQSGDETTPIAIVGVGVVASGCPHRAAFAEALLSGASFVKPGTSGHLEGRIDAFEVDITALGIPPKDLRQILPQQLLLLDAGRQAAAELPSLPRENTGVFVGMGTDPEVARYGARWRLAEWAPALGYEGDRLDEARDGVVGVLESAGVIGTMPNIVANRLNRQLDLGGSSCTVSAEERSGLEAFGLAVRALRKSELDAALVAAVDLSCEPVHIAAARECLGPESQIPGDAAVAVLLKRLADAVRDGDRVYAVVGGDETAGDAQGQSSAPAEELRWGPGSEIGCLNDRWGHAHAASGLLHLAAAALSIHHRRLPNGKPWLSNTTRSSRVTVAAMDGRRSVEAWRLVEHAESLPRSERVFPTLCVFEGRDASAVLEALDEGKMSDPSCYATTSPAPARLVLVAHDADTLKQRSERARAHIRDGAPPGAGVHFRAEPVRGDLAFVFTSAGSAYHGMGQELLATLPELGDRLARRFDGLSDAMGWVFDASGRAPSNDQRLWGASCLSQMHAELTQGLLGLQPDAAIGYSSGESNSLFALGAWTDMDAMRREIAESGLYTTELAGRFDAVARAWSAKAGEKDAAPAEIRWAVWGLMAPVARVRELVANEERVHLAIIHSESDCVIAGDSESCQRIVEVVSEELGAGRCHKLEYNMAAHVPEVDAFRETWLSIHRRKVSPVPGVRFYSGGSDAAYAPDSEACTQTIMNQAHQTLDFSKVVERAWADGVRVFVEHGPMSACSGWIRDVLGERARDAVIVPLDRKGRGIETIFEAIAALVAAGIRVDYSRLLERLGADSQQRPDNESSLQREGPRMRLPAHFDPVRLPSLRRAQRPSEDAGRSAAPASALREQSTLAGQSNGVEIMQPAPTLPSVTDEDWVSPTPAETPVASAPEGMVVANPAHPATAPPENDPAITAWRQQVHQLSQVHQQYVSQQAQVHQRFLALRQSMQVSQEALGRAGASPAPSTQPSATPEMRVAAAPAPQQPAVPTASPARVAAAVPVAASGQPVKSPASPAQERDPVQARAVQHPVGPRLDRAQLEIHASGRISEIYGPMFEQQDGYERQVRMPEPPLLLADRVTGIDAKPGVHGTGIMWTETDVCEDSWYLNRGRMPAGIMIESGQADLMLISYMGADFLNRGERVYRLLGCELTYEGDLPKPGETLCYEIHVDGHARQDDVRLFFFHYECLVDGKPRIRVKGGQAGFFSDEELANSEGILWSPEGFEPVADARLDSPAVSCTRSSFDRAQVRAFAEGRAWECFGAGFEHSRTHTESPVIQSGKMLFLDEVSEFDPTGGPWGRGYLRAESPVRPDDWYFDGHFKNDPCMPGTLMFEGCLQAMSFYLAALGFTLERDGWRFQPVIGEPIEMRCRGQVTPLSEHVVYEVFIEEVIDGPEPTLYADLLCTVDGRKAFHARRAGLKLVPDWPLSSRLELIANSVEARPVASVETPDGGRFDFDQKSILACAWGRPSDAFGPMYSRFDAPGRVPRLPGPPYLFMTRVTNTGGEIGGMEVGSTVEVEYEIPADAWYFAENGARTMPYCVLLEAALQPCGWLASYIGSALTVEDEVCFRNLDGTATLEAELFEDAGTLRTAVTLTNISKSAGMIIVSFDVECFLSGDAAGIEGERRVYVMDTVFGFFPPEALSLENQVGQPTTDEQRALLSEESAFDVDLREEPERYFGGSLRLGAARLRVLDRVTGYWPEGGAAGLGRVRAERNIDAADWYFKAHFFQDPVQPGSLGIEAMIQALQFFMLESGMHAGIDEPRFEPIGLNQPMSWKYRGQVVPLNETVHVTLDLSEVGRDDNGPFAIASASLWCDGIRIYSADGMGMRIVSGAADVERKVGKTSPEAREAREGKAGAAPDSEWVLDPAVDVWLADHCPTWNRPALPMMCIADFLASAVPGRVTALRDVQVKGWVDFAGPRRLWTEVEPRSADLFFVRLLATASATAGRSEGVEVASGRVETGDPAPAPVPLDAKKGTPMAGPYGTGDLFHGPAFQLMKRGEMSDCGASTVLDAGAGSVPIGSLHPALLDAALHGIPHDQLHLWAPEIAADKVGYPARIPELTLHGPIPRDGEVRCEIRFDGYLVKPDLPRFRIQLIGAEGVFAQILLIEACFPKGALGSAKPLERRAFLRDREFVEGVSLSRHTKGETRLCGADVEASDWMPGTIEGIYRSRDVERIAVKEHLALREGLHPGTLPEALPLSRTAVEVSHDSPDVVVRDERGFDPERRPLDLEPLRRFWNPLLGISSKWLGQDLWEGLIQRYVGRVVLEDPDAFTALRGRGAIFVGNHQVQIESLLVTNILSALTGTPVVTMANAKHEQRWIGWILQALSTYPGCRDPESIVYFDQSKPDSMFEILAKLGPELAAGRRAFFVHPQGTRSQSSREPVTKISSIFLDLALELALPIVPVRFSGGLPVQPVFGKLEFPIGHCSQDYTIGTPISPEELRDLAYADRGRRVLAAMNSIGSARNWEKPNAADPVFSELVKRWQKETGASEIEATFFRILQEVEDPGSEALSLIDGARRRVLRVGEDPKSLWLAELAKRLYGAKGPRVEIGA